MEEEAETSEILVRCSKMGVPLGKHTLIKIVKGMAIAQDLARLVSVTNGEYVYITIQALPNFPPSGKLSRAFEISDEDVSTDLPKCTKPWMSSIKRWQQ
ncbi:hypothetical protein RvY_03731 [Ramazzottius varieornatus]|uniref:Uncharacterized protein n=1 Tax=Ramazzottius varieornatus TaxID=947166 RepID=A0A1D1UPX0_RAMVA|nr:hypothetical protein RvY_03731 [Ramazzottius varieornatus]